MYRILVVDDEKLICLGIKSLIERIALPDISDILVSFDGLEAMSLIQRERPDIVITDIRMPGLSGLELIASVKRYDNSTRFIILSGYDDFPYAKEAIKLGVEDYLLKPVSIGEMKTALESAFLALDAEDRRALVTCRDTETERYNPIEGNLNKVIFNEQLSRPVVEEVLDGIRSSFPCRLFLLGLVDFSSSLRQQDCTKVLRTLGLEFQSVVSDKEILIHAYFDYNQNVIVLFNFNDENRYERCREALARSVRTLEKEMQLACAVSLGEIGRGLEEIPALYRQARKTLAGRLIREESRDVLEYRSSKSRQEDYKTLDPALKEFATRLPLLDESEVHRFIDHWFSIDSFGSHSIEAGRRLYGGVLSELGKLTAITEDDALGNFYKDLSSFKRLHDVRTYLHDVARKSFESLKDERKAMTVIDIVTRYLRENYQKDIDMSFAANLVSMSYTYFSRLFKSKTGMNFSEYLTKIRMEEAKHLLDNPITKVNDVSTSVGYANPKHFTRTFKSYFGITPKEYKNGTK
jgi:two-component system, response regulator YesN